ncbi:MAG: hypothetical protein BWX86_01530 [Verrucomicrobia bacterium ADurb.Bin122]|nr:MAG: hypothetical protein BWX86_01530 [Verrucomicrobia bacterium ADurb.Bin122]
MPPGYHDRALRYPARPRDLGNLHDPGLPPDDFSQRHAVVHGTAAVCENGAAAARRRSRRLEHRDALLPGVPARRLCLCPLRAADSRCACACARAGRPRRAAGPHPPAGDPRRRRSHQRRQPHDLAARLHGADDRRALFRALDHEPHHPALAGRKRPRPRGQPVLPLHRQQHRQPALSARLPCPYRAALQPPVSAPGLGHRLHRRRGPHPRLGHPLPAPRAHRTDPRQHRRHARPCRPGQRVRAHVAVTRTMGARRVHPVEPAAGSHHLRQQRGRRRAPALGDPDGAVPGHVHPRLFELPHALRCGPAARTRAAHHPAPAGHRPRATHPTHRRAHPAQPGRLFHRRPPLPPTALRHAPGPAPPHRVLPLALLWRRPRRRLQRPARAPRVRHTP